MSNLVSVLSNLNLTRTLGGRYYCSHLTDKENEASKAEYLHKGSRESISDLNPVSLVAQAAQVTKNPSVMDPSWVRSVGWDDPLEKEMATQPLPGKSMDRGAWRLQSMGLPRVGHD